MAVGFQKFAHGSSGSAIDIDFRTSRILPQEYLITTPSGSVAVTGVQGKLFAFISNRAMIDGDAFELSISGYSVSWSGHAGLNKVMVVGVCGV